uniref:Uncharacterized protein n=1 Tax=Oryza glumipatula TaxID=40148 RepID=A0A0E0ACW5_9ORYZ
MVLSLTAPHRITDGQATVSFLVAWGLATRWLPVGVAAPPLPVSDRATRFVPWDPPRDGVQGAAAGLVGAPAVVPRVGIHHLSEPHRAVTRRGSAPAKPPLPPPPPRSASLSTAVPAGPALWVFPRCDAGKLITCLAHHAAKLIHRTVAGIDDVYFRSFIDFASSGAVEA